MNIPHVPATANGASCFRVLVLKLKTDFDWTFARFLDDAVPSHCKMLDDQCTFVEDGFGT